MKLCPKKQITKQKDVNIFRSSSHFKADWVSRRKNIVWRQSPSANWLCHKKNVQKYTRPFAKKDAFTKPKQKKWEQGQTPEKKKNLFLATYATHTRNPSFIYNIYKK